MTDDQRSRSTTKTEAQAAIDAASDALAQGTVTGQTRYVVWAKRATD